MPDVLNLDTPPGGDRPLPSTVAGSHVAEIVVKKSRFITRIEHVGSVAEADQVIAAVRKEFWDARHNCVALVVGLHADQQRSSDDGEPSGTAGAPMLEVLRHRDVTDVVAVVTRYFGGVLLGTGGLVRAYSSSVSEALDSASLLRRVMMLSVDAVVAHGEAGRMENLLREWCATNGATFGEPAYDAAVKFTVLLPPDRRASLEQMIAAASGGTVEAEPTGWSVAEIPV